MRQDGSRFWGSGAMMAMHNPGGETVGLLKILRDQSQLRQTLDDLEKARQEAEKANQAKDHFLAILSHELRTPLSPVLMGLDSLLEAPPDEVSGSAKEELAMIRKYVNIETQLIDELLDTAKLARGKLELFRSKVDVHAVIRDALFVCRADIESKWLKVGLHLDAAVSTMQGDEVRLKQVFWNLLRNAVKFTSAGGNIALKTFNEEQFLVVEVVDDGCGLDPGVAERIFQPFIQAGHSTRRLGGLGLGLSISRAIMIAHGGTLTCHSDGPGKGSCFQVRLPLAPDDSKAPDRT
jgi:two-component system CheB/CheR fusion protein